MGATRSINRRLVISAMAAGSLGLATATASAAVPTFETGYTGSSLTHAEHPLSGLWLAMVELPSNPGVKMAVPTIFSPDGFVILMFPVTELREANVQLKGASIGTWRPVSDRKGHFTAVQTLSDVDGNYQGSLTIDGYPSVDPDGSTFTENVEEGILTIRDQNNALVSILQGGVSSSMAARRMAPGQSGFPDAPTPSLRDPRTPD